MNTLRQDVVADGVPEYLTATMMNRLFMIPGQIRFTVIRMWERSSLSHPSEGAFEVTNFLH